MKAVTWTVLEERESRLPSVPRFLFRRQDKGSPRIYINIEAVKLMKLDEKTHVQLLAPSDNGNGRPVLGLRVVDPEKGVRLRRSGETRSLCLVTSAALHLARVYETIVYRPRAGAMGEPEWVLEPVASERVADK